MCARTRLVTRAMGHRIARVQARRGERSPITRPARRRIQPGTCRRDERGSVSIQMMILMPVMFLVMFTGMQAALYYHARAIAIAAAQEGAREAGSENGSRDSGAGAARDFISQAGGSDALTSSSVSGSRSATTATVTVTGQSLSVIPGWKVTITQSSSVPVERLTE
ncbi:MAG: TadE/TadG family type IV pilus assembly protein [Nocardioides sp.]